MNCEILRTLCLKANGEILCNDDFGERVSLGWSQKTPEDPTIHEVLNNSQYEHIRHMFNNGEIPWPTICNNCAFLRPNDPSINDQLRKKVIEKIQIEGSLACALKCPMCANSQQNKTRKGGVHFSVAMLTTLLESLKENAYQCHALEFAGQGEPLNNPNFSELLTVARQIYPKMLQRVITNGNHHYADRMGTELIEEIIVSIDGSFQESYEKYRIKGNIAQAFEFIKNAVTIQKPLGGSVTWKYILFETNDSEEEIFEAQRIAQEIGVTRLWFVHSHTANRSKKYRHDNLHTLPIYSPNVDIGSHPSYFRDIKTLYPIGSPTRLKDNISTHCHMHIDRVVLYDNKSIAFSGWVLALKDIMHISICINQHKFDNFTLNITRTDILEFNPTFSETVSGFNSFCILKELDTSLHLPIFFSVLLKGNETVQFSFPLDNANNLTFNNNFPATSKDLPLLEALPA